MSDESLPFEGQSLSRDQQTTILSGISGASLSYLPGDVVDGAYQLLRLLGRGGMGAVYECRHMTLDQRYAIKLLAGNQLSSETWNRFQAEAKSLARLNHPGIVRIYNMGIDNNQCPYYVMDLLIGESLDSRIERGGKIAVVDCLDIFAQVADGLSAAHVQGIIHRDIKPSNIMIAKEGQSAEDKVKIVDFGIARLPKHDSATQSQTATGLIFGTPFYMSPEQCEGSRVDERSDIYSFGCALFEALTGAPPFVGNSAFQTFLMHQTEKLPTLNSRLTDKSVPESLQAAMEKMLAKKPVDRYQTIKQVGHDLERIKAGKPIMAQGVNITIPPKLIEKEGPTSTSKRRLLTDETDNSTHEFESIDESAQDPKNYLMPLAAVSLLGITLFAIWFALDHFVFSNQKPLASAHKKNQDETPSLFNAIDERAYDPKRMRAFGASEAEISSISAEEIAELATVREDAEKDYEVRRKDSKWLSTRFYSGQSFHFPTDIYLGAISIDGKPAVRAVGDIEAPRNKDAFLYLITSTNASPEILHKFGPQDLTGIAMVFHDEKQIPEIISTLSHWSRLKDVWFFNPLLKTISPKTEDWAESRIEDQNLSLLNSIKGLRSVGLCNHISAKAILKSSWLKKIDELALERTQDFPVLLKALPGLTNLKSLFLMEQKGVSEDALETLTQMPNLQKLTILRSHLTKDSRNFFKKMKHLNYLRLDRNDWSTSEKDDLKKAMPGCNISYEKVIDRTYWYMFPENSPNAWKEDRPGKTRQ